MASLDFDSSYDPGWSHLAEARELTEGGYVRAHASTGLLSCPPNAQLKAQPSELTPPPSPNAKQRPYFTKPTSHQASELGYGRWAFSQSATPPRSSSPTKQRMNNAASAFMDLFQGSSELVTGFKSMSAKLSPNNSASSHAHYKADDILNIDIDEWLRPDDADTLNDVIDKARNVLFRMQLAYQDRLDQVERETSLRKRVEDDLRAEKANGEHNKVLLEGCALELEEERAKTAELSGEMAKHRRRAGVETIRQVNLQPETEVKVGSDRWGRVSTSTGGESSIARENQALRVRVAELEGVVETCLAQLDTMSMGSMMA